jgi:hypothetical protein
VAEIKIMPLRKILAIDCGLSAAKRDVVLAYTVHTNIAKHNPKEDNLSISSFAILNYPPCDVSDVRSRASNALHMKRHAATAVIGLETCFQEYDW